MRVRHLLPLGALLVTATVTPAAAGPGQLPVDGAGAATPNVKLLAHVATVGGGVSGAFLDKSTYVLSVADEVWNETNLPVAATGGVVVFNVSNPASPQVEGTLPIPNYQNEDIAVSTKRRFAVLSQDAGVGVSGRINLIDLSTPSLPTLSSITQLPAGTGHTATLVDDDRYLWVSGGPEMVVVDIRDLSKPVVLGTFPTPAGEKGPSGYVGVHDAEVDRFGDITVYGSGGTAVHRIGRDPLHPQLVAQIDRRDNTSAVNGLIHHGGKRLDRDTWLLTEEDYSPGCGSDGKQDGAFEVWRLDRTAHRLRYVSQWDAPSGADNRGPLVQPYCSSHWFDVNSAGVVADGWYGAGVRFLDLADPAHPRPIGTWAGDSTTASQAVFVPGRPDIVYVADYVRGLDVVQIDKGGRGARTVSPTDERPVGGTTLPGSRLRVKLVPDPRWGWSCAVPAHHAS